MTHTLIRKTLAYFFISSTLSMYYKTLTNASLNTKERQEIKEFLSLHKLNFNESISTTFRLKLISLQEQNFVLISC